MDIDFLAFVYLLLSGMILGIIPGLIAHSKGRSFWQWWLYGAFIFIVALVHSILIVPDAAATERRQIASGMKKCPHCAEMVKSDATICRYCGHEVPPADTIAVAPKIEPQGFIDTRLDNRERIAALSSAIQATRAKLAQATTASSDQEHA